MKSRKGRPPNPVEQEIDANGGTTDVFRIYHLNAHGLGKRFARRFGKFYKVRSEDDVALAWNGKLFTTHSYRKERLARAVIRTIRCEAAQGARYKTTNGDEVGYEDIVSFHNSSSSAAGVNSALTAVRAEKGITVPTSAFDAYPHLLNVQNGVVDLRTGELIKHSPELLLTKLANASYIPDAICPYWHGFLQVFCSGDIALMALIQRVAGYLFTGETIEQKLFLLYGPGGNGKSVFLETLLHILKDYGQTAEPRTFLNTNSRLLRDDIARMMGVRMVLASEFNEGDEMDMSISKRLTGGERVTASRLRKQPIEFEPQCKIVLATNNYPAVSDRTHGSRRRFIVIPCKNKISSSEDDKRLKEKLRAERDGILAWCVEGAKQWYAHGLGSCNAVERATQDFWEATDYVKTFLDAFTTAAPGRNIPMGELHRAYVAWAQDNCPKPLGKKQFGAYLRQRGLQDGRITGGTWVWQDLAFKPSPPPVMPALAMTTAQEATQ